MEWYYELALDLLGFFIGGLITWLVAKLYYEKAGVELLEETRRLRKLMSCLAILQKDEKGQYAIRFDDEGVFDGLTGHLSMKENEKISESVIPVVKRATDEDH